MSYDHFCRGISLYRNYLDTVQTIEQIELLELDQKGIHVAEYLTELPPRQLLEQKLHEAIALSKARFENSAKNIKSKPEK